MRSFLSRWIHGLSVGLKAAALTVPGRDRTQQPDRVVAELHLAVGARVADLGSGGGYFTLRLAEAVGPQGIVYAVDTDADLRAYVGANAHRRGLVQVKGVAAAADRLALPESVDLVFACNVFHHLPEQASYFRTVAGTLRPGGRVAILEARGDGFLRRIFGHATAPATIRAVMDEAGFALVADHPYLAQQSFGIFALA